MSDEEMIPTPTPTPTGRQFLVPVPATRAELDALRITPRKPSINVLIEMIVLDHLWQNADFRALVSGLKKEESVEGTLLHDHSQACAMVRDKAGELHLPEIANLNLHRIWIGVARALKLHKQDPKTRKALINGAAHPTTASNEPSTTAPDDSTSAG